MKTEHIITIFTIMIGIITPISILYLNDAGTFRSLPIFDVKAELETEDEPLTKLTITNIGSSQAKDVAVYIEGTKDTELIEKNCVEGTFPINQSENIIVINFNRMSSNVICTVIYTNSQNSDPDKVTITGKEIPGQKFKIFWLDDWDKPLVSSAKTNTKSVISILMDNPGIFLVIEIVVLSPITFVIRIKQKKHRKELESKVEMLLDKILKTDKEFVIIKKIQNNDAESQLRKNELYHEIINTKRELDSTKSKIFLLAKRKQWISLQNYFKIIVAIKKLDMFFDDWRKLERQIIRLAEEKEQVQDDTSISATAKLLHQNGDLETEFMGKYENALKFRNTLAHGTIKLSDLKIKNEIDQLKKLQKELNNAIQDYDF